MKTIVLALISICIFSCSTVGTGHRKLASIKEIPFEVTNNSYSLSGQINDVEGSKTAAIFFHGSGVHDRWETMPAELTLTKKPEPFFKPISEELNRQGISTVVFDKRAYAEKGKPEFEKVIKTFSFENIKADAKTIVSYVNELNRFEKIILIGHSEGTVTASEIAFDLKNNKKIKKLVLIGVLAENLKTSLYHQLTDVMANNSFKLADKNQDGKIYADEIPDSLKPGLPVDKIDKDKKGYIVYNDLLAILTKQADGLISAINEAPAETIISGKPVQWYRDLINRKTLLDRAKEYSIPVLIAHGELDQNVFFKTNALALNNKLLSLKKEVALKSFPNYGHCLSLQNDGLPNLGPIAKDAVDGIVNWLSAESSQFAKVDADIQTVKNTVMQMRNEFNKIPIDVKNINWVKSKIKNMFDVDQYFRKTTINLPVEHEYTEEERHYFEKTVGALFEEVDSRNTADIKSLIQIYKWFRISQFGEEIDEKAWLLVQHADYDPEFQKSVLAVLEDLVKVNETNATNFAYLFDRVAASWSNPTKRTLQRFGTQGTCAGVNKWEPIPIEYPEDVNTRRASVGLPSIEEYRNHMNKYCK